MTVNTPKLDLLSAVLAWIEFKIGYSSERFLQLNRVFLSLPLLLNNGFRSAFLLVGSGAAEQVLPSEV